MQRITNEDAKEELFTKLVQSLLTGLSQKSDDIPPSIQKELLAHWMVLKTLLIRVVTSCKKS